MRLEPINDFVILKKMDSSQELHGIILPEENGQQIVRATCISAGPGRVLDSGEREPMQIAAGDEVYVNTYACAPTQLPLDEEGEFLLIPQKDVAAIIRHTAEAALSSGASSLEVAAD